MTGLGVTAAAIIRFSEELEDSSSALYEDMARRWARYRDTFLSFAMDCKKNKRQVVRTYQETISDAYETSFSFEGFNPGEYVVDTMLADDANCIEGLERAIALEENASAFYIAAAARSESLLATIPRAFKRVARKRGKRKLDLESMLEEMASGS